MKYTCNIIVNKPIKEVYSLWEDENNFSKWQDDFENIILLEGVKNKINSKSKITFNGKRPMELIETIITNNLPLEKKALYEHIHMSNTQTTKFEQIDKNKTLFTSEVEYIKFNGFMIKLMANLFPNKFKKQSEKWMLQFKKFVENKN